MDEQQGTSTNWQSLGSTLNNEFRYVTHLDPPLGRLNESGVHKQRLQRNHSTRSFRSREVPSLHRHASMRLTARLKRFVQRLSWQRRSRSYLYGQNYLQRQPSFVMTPDRSSFIYNFRSRDLAKRHPHPRFDRSSQPVAVWKNANPMNALLNQGQVEAPQLSAVGADSQPNHSRKHSKAPSHFKDLIDLGEDEPNKAWGSAADETARSAPQNWAKVTLPVKQDRAPESPQDGPEHVGDRSTPLRTPEQAKVSSSSKSGSASGERTRSGGSRGGGSTSILDIPATPLETRKPQPRAVDLPSVKLPHALQGGDQVAPRSPTSARSLYRPESWRRSALVSRHEQLDQNLPELEVAIEFVGAWSTYLRRAIAGRAVATRERKSWELQNEHRWSQNLPYESDIGSLGGSSAQTNPEDFDISLTSSSSSSNNKSNNSGGETSESHSSSQGPHPGEEANMSGYSSESIESFAESSSSLISEIAQDDSNNDLGSNTRARAKEAYLGSSSVVSDPPASSSSIQYTPEAISVPAPTASVTQLPNSVLSQSPMKSTSSLAPPNSPRALAAMARTSAERKRFSDSLDAAEKRYAVLFHSEESSPSPDVIGKVVERDDLGELKQLSQWQPEDLDKDSLGASGSSESLDTTHVAALRYPKAQPQSENVLQEQTLDDFDFEKSRTSRKRPLPISPVSTPPPNPLEESTFGTDTSRTVQHSRQSSGSSMGEDAPSLLKSQSVRRHLGGPHKRVRSSASKDNMLLMRQNTLRSQWAEEDSSDTDASEHLVAHDFAPVILNP